MPRSSLRELERRYSMSDFFFVLVGALAALVLLVIGLSVLGLIRVACLS
jgi:hypothetical protein